MAPKSRASSKRQRGETSQAREQPQAPTFERFQTAEAFGRYQRLMSTRSIRQERGLEIEVPARWNWGPRFLAQPGDAFGTVVREFYANAKDGLQNNVCIVRGVQVDFSCAAINAYYGTIDHHGDDYYHRDLSVGMISRVWLNNIALSFNPAAEWNIRSGLASHMDYKYFQPSDRAILDFIKAKLIPHSHKGNVRRDQVLLAYCIKEHKTIDIGAIINRNIRETADVKGRVYLGHSYLITHLCQLAGVPIDESQEARVLPQSYLSQQYIATRYRLGQPPANGDDDDGMEL
ncbi:PREDICTED: uncharacterized protein LOC109169324 [Ipomoea nil]|uniref:uncharacterized protein LOC109169324 n=1 Tax=Ipomoea nil TaxID=35883 RepID=UPI000901353D|nr:PREDICTED: uncharacterized protein LOC109169324 [Ipomoea nil]XP_019173744.1 PREDICTED: uncharacterized protein LOC109169324 [Ipomoea nil]XP_019173745.1 PREDICTED: uncharacterized protein LOC109169324 [Ipomoea nil]XP_019173746.1 PREDICTED: uncharacterized protein LOC109169324 [Ipomoea nil]